MKFASLDRFGISVWKLAAFSLLGSVGAGLLTWVLIGGALGEARTATVLVVATLVLYILLSTPRRILDRQRVAQARESLAFSAAAMACLSVTGSRPKTLVLLRPRDATLASSTAEAGRRVLLGGRVEEAVADSTQSLVSYSAAAALLNVASMRPRDFDAGDEEARGLAGSSELSRETKIPVFMTVCFFSPIMLVLYAVFTRSYDPEILAELAALEFVALDFAFYLSANDRGPR
jgi:hypothetical protein